MIENGGQLLFFRYMIHLYCRNSPSMLIYKLSAYKNCQFLLVGNKSSTVLSILTNLARGQIPRDLLRI